MFAAFSNNKNTLNQTERTDLDGNGTHSYFVGFFTSL